MPSSIPRIRRRRRNNRGRKGKADEGAQAPFSFAARRAMWGHRVGQGTAGVKIIGFTGWSGAGKTQLIVRLIPILRARGLTVSTIKHAHHGFDIDRPGKDSHNHRLAGAREVLISSGRRFALMHELHGAEEWQLGQLIRLVAPVDLLFVEGFKRDPHPKIEVFRAENGKPALWPDNPTIRALASDQPFPEAGIPVYHLDSVEEIANAVVQLAVPLDSVFPGGA